MWLRRGPRCRRPSNPRAVGPNSPLSPAPTCQVGPQSPVSWCSLPHSGERASECNEMPGTTSGARFLESPQCNGAMNQSSQLRNSGKKGPMQPAPLTSGGLALQEITCRGWGPHLQYSFLINFFFFFLFMDVENKIELKSPKLHTQGPPGTARTALGSMPVPKTAKNRGILILQAHVSPDLGAEAWAQVVVALATHQPRTK